MKKTTLIKNTKIFVVFLTLLFSIQIQSQCINTTPFADVLADNSGTPQEIAWCYQANNYCTISGLISGGDYVFTVSGNNGPGYVTITTTTNTVIAHGPSPLTVNNVTATTVRFHSADNVQCVTSNCYTSTLQFVPACPQPVNLSCTGITTTGALASWTAGGTETLWDLEYGTQGFSQGSGTFISNLTAPNYTFSSLTPGATYQFYVKAKCTVDEQSFWSGPFTFTTLCNPVTEIYENFDGIASNLSLLPGCWSRIGQSFQVQVISGSGSPATAPNYLQLFSLFSSSYALLPPVSNLNANTHRLRFNAFSNAPNTFLEVGYLTNPTDATTFTVLNNIALPFGDFSQAQAYTILPGVLPAGVTVLAFKYTPTSGFNSSPVYVDDVRWELNSTCLEPTLASAITITDTSAELIWNPGSTETQWEIQYGPQNFTLGQGTTVSNLTSASYSLLNLTSNTNYQYYVRAICAGNGSSGWSNPLTFKTDCTPVTTFTENFDTTNAWSGLLPECWIKAGNSSLNEVISGSTMSEPNYLNINGEDPISTAYAIMPSVSNLQAGTHRLRFRANSNNPQAILQVGYISDVNNIATYVYLTEFQVGLNANGNNTDFSLVPTGITPGVKNLVFKNGGIPGASTNFYIDDVKWEPIPACQEPTELSLVAVASTTATLGWVANGTATQWEIRYGAPGFLIENGTVVIASTNPYVLSGLASNTAYEFYIRSICSTSSSSVWVGPFQFKTLCADVTEFFENFDTTEAWQGLIPSCWSRGTNNTFSNAVIGDSQMSAPNCLNMDAFAEFAELYTVMPSVSNLQANTHRLRFKVQGSGFDSGVLEVGYMTNLNDISTFVVLQEFQIPLSAAILDFFYTPPTTIPAGIKNLVFKNKGSLNGPLNLRIDDVKWEPIPTVAPVCTDGLTAVLDPDCGTASVLLSWNSTPNADTYRITIGTTPGGSQILNNLDIGSSLSYLFQSPTAATTYYWKIVPYNTAGFPTTCTSVSFITPNGVCYCSPTYVNGKIFGDLISNVAIAGTTLANTTGTATLNPAYTLFVGQPNYTATLQAGQSFDMTVTVGPSGNQNVAVWIDTNDNGIYETNERVGYTTNPIGFLNSGTFTLNIPCATPQGLYRMRVRNVWAADGEFIQPCLQYSNGETEDYYVTINAATLPATPTGDAIQTINVSTANEATIEDLVVTGTNIQWFATQADALVGANPLATTTVITNGSVYYAVSVEGSCLSAPLAVTVTVTLGINDFDSANFKYYPNPVTDRLSIAYSDTISEVIVYNILGQQVIINRPNATQTQIDLSQLNAGTYVVKVTLNNLVKSVKVIKQ